MVAAVQEPKNPFRSKIDYSDEVVELMRLLSRKRVESGRASLSPGEILSAVEDSGYTNDGSRPAAEQERVQTFVETIASVCRAEGASAPTVDHLASALRQLGYVAPSTSHSDAGQAVGVPFDTRYGAADTRAEKTERRKSRSSSVQEKLQLTDEERAFLEALVVMRRGTGRAFASSEELLSVAWSLNYRPAQPDGTVRNDLTEEERCRYQSGFSGLLEKMLAEKPAGYFVTVRALLGFVQQIGFARRSPN